MQQELAKEAKPSQIERCQGSSSELSAATSLPVLFCRCYWKHLVDEVDIVSWFLIAVIQHLILRNYGKTCCYLASSHLH